ncbi:flagellar hook capping FlgD N-terminal domain-containing protein [Celeribacter sp.]|uniref:flagellar hook capping FlgD N-terminal domain-containing protein n=1 Tax=Celeribacter sp. TaxID=1890673 RepID=UPI003A95B43E
MTEITQTQTTQTSYPSASTTTSTTENALSSDFETFLKMLTVQLKNQDPLNPIESTDYAVQLATFSGVEQQVLTNDLINDLSTQLGVIGMSQATGWVGMDVETDAPVQFNGDPVDLKVQPQYGVDQSFLIVRDSGGGEVQRIALDPHASEFTWSGIDANGTQFNMGTYEFIVENHANGQFHSNSDVSSFGRVIEARRDGGDILLVLESGAVVSADSVAALREGG